MSVVEIKEAMQKLTLDEIEELTRWMNEQRVKAEADAWDKQIEDDINAGRLDDFMAAARAEIKAGRTRPMP